MLWVDFIIHVVVCWFLISRISVLESFLERSILAMALALVLKSLEVFGALALGWRLEVLDQFLLGWVGLAIAGYIYFKRNGIKSGGFRNPFVAEEGTPPWWTASLLLTLSGLSLYIHGVFPINESDGIWYYLRGLTFYQESDLSSEVVHPQYRAYPPFLSLLYAWILSMKVSFLTWVFPMIYLALMFLFWFRVRAAGSSRNLAGMLTAILASTPYFWWHSLQPILNLVAGFFYSIGILYGYFLCQELLQEDRPLASQPAGGWAVISGLGFGVAAWTRPEFVLYGAIFWGLLVYMLSQREFARQMARESIFLAFTLSFLILPTLWTGFLWVDGGDIPESSRAISDVVLAFWVATGMVALGWVPRNRWIWFSLCFLPWFAFAAVLASGSRTGLSVVEAVNLGFLRTFGFHAFYSFLWVFVFLLFLDRWKRWTPSMKTLLGFLMAYMIFHFMLYTLLPFKSTSVAQYFDSILVSLGDAVNSPDTRELLAFYPALLFLVSLLPKIRRAIP